MLNCILSDGSPDHADPRDLDWDITGGGVVGGVVVCAHTGGGGCGGVSGGY